MLKRLIHILFKGDRKEELGSHHKKVTIQESKPEVKSKPQQKGPKEWVSEKQMEEIFKLDEELYPEAIDELAKSKIPLKRENKELQEAQLALKEENYYLAFELASPFLRHSNIYLAHEGKKVMGMACLHLELYTETEYYLKQVALESDHPEDWYYYVYSLVFNKKCKESYIAFQITHILINKKVHNTSITLKKLNHSYFITHQFIGESEKAFAYYRKTLRYYLAYPNVDTLFYELSFNWFISHHTSLLKQMPQDQVNHDFNLLIKKFGKPMEEFLYNQYYQFI